MPIGKILGRDGTEKTLHVAPRREGDVFLDDQRGAGVADGEGEKTVRNARLRHSGGDLADELVKALVRRRRHQFGHRLPSCFANQDLLQILTKKTKTAKSRT